MEEKDLNESVDVTESSMNDDDELIMINNNQTVIRSKTGAFTSRTFTFRTNGPLNSRTNGPLNSRTNQSIVLERDVRGKVITINRAKHYGFLKRNGNVECRDIFAREASIINDTRQQKLFINDNCEFDIICTL